jgi:antitoxin (DNA-binding transcriptional repressor) of toxin-antitoxin stability system
MGAQTVTITDFIRNFGKYAELLPKVEGIIVTRDGRPFARIEATPEEKNRGLPELRRSLHPQLWANDKVWKEIAKRRNRRSPPVRL